MAIVLALAFIACNFFVARGNDALLLLQKHAIRQIKMLGPNPSPIPAGCQPELVAAGKKCKELKYLNGKAYPLRVTYTAGEGVPYADNTWGFSNGSMQPDGNQGQNFAEGIVGAWVAAIRQEDCCSSKFLVCHHQGKWRVMCSTNEAFEAGLGDYCDELNDDPDCFVYDGATESCGTADLKGKDTCVLNTYQLKAGCMPKLVHDNRLCARDNVGGGLHGWGRKTLPRAQSAEACMVEWTKSGDECCGGRIDWDPVSGSCGCAQRLGGYNGAPFFCNDDFIRNETYDNMDPQYVGQAGFYLRTGCPDGSNTCSERDSPGGRWLRPDQWVTADRRPQPAVYDIGHCLHPHLHDCPVDPGEFKADPCAAVVSANLQKPVYSNLAGQGPDSDVDDHGVLFPAAVESAGKMFDLKITAPDLKSFTPAKNAVIGGLGKLNIHSGTEAEFTAVLLDQRGQPSKIDGTLAVTFLDLDEGKKGKGRTTVSSCQAVSMAAGAELATNEDGGCKHASSTKKGARANNPTSVDDVQEDHKLRSVTFMFEPAAEYKFKLAVSNGSRGRNVMFSLTPILGCKK